MKSTFLNYDKPLITAMIQYPTPEECIAKIKASIEDGADAIGIQFCKLRTEYYTKEVFSEIFAACQGKPTYVTCYPYGEAENLTDEQRADVLRLALSCGATLIDVYGFMYGGERDLEINATPEAIIKQKAFIEEIHQKGGEVLFSSHTHVSLTKDIIVDIAKKQIERGADVIKIVSEINTVKNLPEFIEAIAEIKSITDKKLLFLATGECDILRYIGPSLGVCMYLCVAYHGPIDTAAQPLISRIKPIRDNIKFI